ncbi:MAG: hypothetical protein CTR55_19220 [Pseudomonas sp.]|uniref:hypothetical protein n=1 Tax=Pseudomonas sp. TaxID=306 RepID=UPI000CBC64F4|nr:hypothetical protein [Pseudomonas sp.]PJI47474.1 MAG: hypothetical protein CTR55_19220 [Pseudomonas sp.]
MFRTHKQAEIPLDELYGGDARLWSIVEHSLHSPWFYVSVLEGHPGQTLCTMLIVQEVPVLEALLALQSETMKIESVQLVTPSYLNNTDSWRMEGLSELVLLQSADSHCYQFLVECGRRYVDGDDAVQMSGQWIDRRVIYQC